METLFYHNYPQKSVSATFRKIVPYTKLLETIIHDRDYTKHESALAIAGDTKYQNAITKALLPYSGVKHVVLVGIGGSSLGTDAVYNALKTSASPSLTVLDDLENESLDVLSAFVKRVKNPADIVLVIVSKSGATTETVCNADAVLEIFEKSYGEAHRKQVIVIGDPDSSLVLHAKKKKILALTIPKSIGGRYSVFTAVGIVPLTLLGIDVSELRKGAVAGVSQNEIEISAESASVLAYSAQNGVRVVNFFTFTKRFQTIGYWYRQLLAESLGKSRTKSKKAFTHQLLPTVSSSIDLHSVAQLYLGGYTGIYTKFIQVVCGNITQTVRDSWVSSSVSPLPHKTMNDVKNAITVGVLKAYSEAGLPHQITYVEKLDAFEVGRILAQAMTEVMCLCTALNVDAFDQPNVESYKKHMHEALTQ